MRIFGEFLVLMLVFGAIVCFKNPHMLEKCCSYGGRLGIDGKDCRTMNLIPGVANNDQPTCRDIVGFCCDRERLHLDCKLGEIFAKTYDHCDLGNSTRGCSTQAESCCSACLLASSLKRVGLDCEVPGVVDVTLSQVFQRCCDGNQLVDEEMDKDYDEETKNLCEVLPGQLCAQICIPTPNSYYCRCNEGFTLMEDQKSCQPEKAKPKIALPLAPPVPNPEKPVPLKKITPYPAPPPSQSKCSESSSCDQECSDTPAGQVCSCRPGFELHADRRRCLDINECLDNIHVCDPALEICQNEVGTYRCEPRPIVNKTTPAVTTPITTTPKFELKRCFDGFVLEGDDCVDVNECDSSNLPEACEAHELCVNTQGSFECRCSPGFQKQTLNGPCQDINECQSNTHNCLSEQRCDNTVGSYVCHRLAGCGTGYTLNANLGICEDDDECALKTDNCRFLGSRDQKFQCKNTQGSFRCEPVRCTAGDANCSKSLICNRGYQENPVTKTCVDINECQQGMHNCNPNIEVCVNRRGGFHCQKKPNCPNGYEYLSRGCVDIDECQSGNHSCGPNSDCRNHPGGYTCYCHTGYQKISDDRCVDIDECTSYGCPHSADCQNTPGSYRCICKQGFTQDGPFHCSDENECETPGTCEHHCINTYGSFRCTCKNGYYLSENNRTCSDIDECTRFPDQQLCIGMCVNTPGSFECSCPPGYQLGGDGRTCQDVDECSRNPCRGKYEVCLNTGGSYACNSIACPPGYVTDGNQKNRCKLGLCLEGLHICRQKPATISYNFITFVSNLHIPPVGYLDLYALRGPVSQDMEAHFDLIFKNVDAPPDLQAANRDYFYLRNPGWGQAVVALRKPIPGPQRIELELTANILRNGVFTGQAVARLNIHVSNYEY